MNESGQRQEKKPWGGLTVGLILSLGLHLVFVGLLLAAWLAADDGQGITYGVDYISVTKEPARESPKPAQDLSEKPQEERPRKIAPNKSALASSNLTTTVEPTQWVSDDDGSEPEPSVNEPEESGGGSELGDPSGIIGGLNLTPGYGAMMGSLDPSPECMDRLDNDGDLLVDTEDPGCLVAETAEEEARIRLRAALLQQMRRDDVPRADPEKLRADHIRNNTRIEEDQIVYQDGSFRATLKSDGTVRFDSQVQGNSLGMSFDTTPRSQRNFRQKMAFLEETEEVRNQIYLKNRHQDMSRALGGLRNSLEKIWRDPSLTAAQKKALLFDRLDECDLDSSGGRKAAREIIAFIREHSKSSSKSTITRQAIAAP